jgi:hypothetical protein
MPMHSGRIRARSFFNGASEYGHPIRCAIARLGIFGHSLTRIDPIAGSAPWVMEALNQWPSVLASSGIERPLTH